MVIDYRKSKKVPSVVTINGSIVERVDRYKYLGVVIDNRLSWHEHVEALLKNLSSRMYCMRIMKKFNVNKNILAMFYNSVICGVWQYNLLSWGGNTRTEDKNAIDAVIRQASRLIGEVQPSLATSYQRQLGMKLQKIIQDNGHPLSVLLHNAVIPRSGSMRLPYSSNNRHLSSFIPQCIKFHNLTFKR